MTQASFVSAFYTREERSSARDMRFLAKRSAPRLGVKTGLG
jgi:hypothetical protein